MKLSIHLMKGNSALLLNCVPNPAESHIDGIKFPDLSFVVDNLGVVFLLATFFLSISLSMMTLAALPSFSINF